MKTEQDLRDMIGERCKQQSRQQVANDLDVEVQYISMILSKKNPRGISADIAEKLGFKRHVAVQKVFEPIENAN